MSKLRNTGQHCLSHWIFQLQGNITSEATTGRSYENKLLQDILKIPSNKSAVVTHLNLNCTYKFLTFPKVVLVANTGQKYFQNFLGKTQAYLLSKVVKKYKQVVDISLSFPYEVYNSDEAEWICFLWRNCKCLTKGSEVYSVRWSKWVLNYIL